MKFKKISILFVVLSIRICFSAPEIYINNASTSTILYIRVYPVSMVFNGHPSSTIHDKHYDLRAINTGGVDYKYINGVGVSGNEKQPVFQINPGQYNHGINHDINLSDFTFCSIGFGVYRIDFYWTHYPDIYVNDPPDDYCTIEYDAGSDPTPYPLQEDVSLNFYTGATGTFIMFGWAGTGIQQNIHDVNNKIEAWNQLGNGSRLKTYGDYFYDNFNNSPYNTIPLDPRQNCALPGFYPIDQNNLFFKNDIGVLTQNLTIKKNVTTPVLVWNEEFPSFPPIVITGDPQNQNGAKLKLAKLTSGFNIMTFKKYLTYNNGTSLTVDAYGTLELEGSDNPGTRTEIKSENYGNFNFSTGSRLIMGKNSKFNLEANSSITFYPNSNIDAYSLSNINVYSGCNIYDCGVNVNYNYDNRDNLFIVYNGGHYFYNTEYCNVNPGLKTFNENEGIIIDGGNFTIGSGNTVVFDGNDSKMQVTSGSTIYLGEGASIEFKNGAYLDADGATFININQNDVWNGLKFEDAGISSIQNCTFSGAETFLDFDNTVNGAENKITISGNTFNYGKIKIKNTTNCIVSNNNFSCSGISGNLLDLTHDIIMQPRSWSLNIFGNYFTGGTYQVKINGLAGNVAPFYVSYNNFNGGSPIGFWAMNIAGAFKNNAFNSDYYSVAHDLINSDMDLYNNTYFSGNNANVYLSASTVKMAPVVNDNNQLLWFGGLNKLDAGSSNCLYFSIGSNASVDKGNNCFTLRNPSYNHISGSYSFCFDPTYYSARNLWNSDPPQINVLCDGNPMSFSYIPQASECLSSPPAELTQLGISIEDMGNGFYDTVLVTTNYGGGQGGGYNSKEKVNSPPVLSGDKILYSQALVKKRQKDHTGSITACKNIINDFDSSKYLINALDILFINHQYLDTIHANNQQFTSLKEYLNQKMQQYQGNAGFTDKAYSYYLKSITKLKQYSEAIAGYENIMANHPDPIVRLAASWERAAVILLMGTGGKNENANNITDMSAEYKKYIKKLFDNNPAHNIAKDNYKLQKRTIEANNRNPFTEKEKSEIENLIIKYNPVNCKELAKRSEEDYLKMLNILNTHDKTNKQHQLPKRYKLYQNYPNPFNPKTHISFDLPKDMDIRLTVYDVLGREVYSIHELYKAGSNKVEFDGSNLASGVYYYSLEAGTFAETKKMVLIK